MNAMFARPFAIAVTLASIGLAGEAVAQTPPPARVATTSFQNVRIFDGRGAGLSAPSHVLVEGNVIERISTAPIAVDRSADTSIIDGGGRTLMPGRSTRTGTRCWRG
jgi:hypothetical protein